MDAPVARSPAKGAVRGAGAHAPSPDLKARSLGPCPVLPPTNEGDDPTECFLNRIINKLNKKENDD